MTHELLKNAPDFMKPIFRDIIISIVEEIHNDMTPQSFYGLVRMGCDHWIDHNQPDLPIIYTPTMRQNFYEIVRDVLKDAYKFEPAEMGIEVQPCYAQQ